MASIFGLTALALAAYGWWIAQNGVPAGPNELADVVSRSFKVLILSDIYENPSVIDAAKPFLAWARTLGVAFYFMVAIRLALVDFGAVISRLIYRSTTRNHDVIIGAGPCAVEYAATYTALFGIRRAIHMADDYAPTVQRVATFARRGNLETQLRDSVARRARRIIVDEGDDADTWQAAQAIARECPKAEVLAHITDPWMRDRLSREEPRYGLAAFSYAGGAARQVMLAHPPFLLAERLGAPVQHILIIGFGQVGQSIAREFIVTSAMPGASRMMITVIDPEAARLKSDFEGRHEDLVKAVDFNFIVGDFRLNSDDLRNQVLARNATAAICAVYVAIDLDRRPLGLALSLRAMATQRALFRAPIFVCAQHGAGLPVVRQGAGYVGGDPARQMELEKQARIEGRLSDLRVTSFGSWPEAFDGAGLLEREFDGQAKLFHVEYEKLRAEQQRRKNPDAVVHPATPWERLEDQFRVSNRRVAAHMRAKAKVAGFDLQAWLDGQDGGWKTHDLPSAGAFFHVEDAAFMRRMGEFEHARWMLDRYLDGWRYGAEKDNYKRLRPELVPFDQLDSDNVHKDDEVIRTTKELMDGAGSRGRRGD